MSRFTTFLSAGALLLAVGCSSTVTSYAFSNPSFDQQAWSQVYPANRDEQPVKCTLHNDNTGANIQIVEDQSKAPSAKYAAMAYRFKYRNAGYEVSEITESEDTGGKYAGFTMTADGKRGKVVAIKRPDVKSVIVMIGKWKPESNARACMDMDRLAAELNVAPYEVPHN